MEYIVNIQINGRFINVGKIIGNDSSNAVFEYDSDYLLNKEFRAISLSLPLQKESFSPEQTKRYFEGLLPEGFTRKAISEYLRLDELDYINILYHLGRECIGALQIIRQGEDIDSRYESLNLDDIKRLANEGVTESVAMVIGSRLSLAGATGKVGLYLDPVKGNWYLPKGVAPSTHIVKQSHVRLKQIVQNEYICTVTAKNCGITVPDTFVIDIGKGKDEDILLASKRYDRYFPEQADTIENLLLPERLHQEDFAQALGIPSYMKYENDNDNEYLKVMFELLRKYSSRPVQDCMELWDRIVFNYLIGNTDGHLKNHSLLYSSDMKRIRLAPAYDIVNTTGYTGMTHNMAFSIGGVTKLDDITRDSFVSAAKDAGIGVRHAMERFDSLVSRFVQALDKASVLLENQGVQGVENLRKRILETGGIHLYLRTKSRQEKSYENKER